MQFDQHRNLAISTFAAVPSNALNGTDFAVQPGDGFMFTPGMPVTICRPDQTPTIDSAEIGYITAVNGDELVVERGCEGSFRHPAGVGWVIVGSLTAKSLTDVESAIQAMLAAAPGTANDLAEFTAALADGDRTFTQEFMPTADLTVTHGLNKRPAVTVIDSAGDEVIGAITYLDLNTVRAVFSAPFGGRIICN